MADKANIKRIWYLTITVFVVVQAMAIFVVLVLLTTRVPGQSGIILFYLGFVVFSGVLFIIMRAIKRRVQESADD